LEGSAAARNVSPPTILTPKRQFARGGAPIHRFPFDDHMKIVQRENAALAPNAMDFEYLRDEIALRVVDRIGCIQRSFSNVIDIGCNAGGIAHYMLQANYLNYPYIRKSHIDAVTEIARQEGKEIEIPTRDPNLPQLFPGFSGLQSLTQYDVSPILTSRSHDRAKATLAHITELKNKADRIRKEMAGTPEVAEATIAAMVANEGIPGEATIQEGNISAPELKQMQGPLADFAQYFKPNSVDMITSSMALHWVNDLPKFFKGVMDTLQPDGVFIGAMLGGNTLQELRSSLVLADTERFGGVTPHMSPLASPRDIGDLMSAAGFNMVSVDVDTITINYPDLFTLIAHLQGMGENGAPVEHLRASKVNADTFLAAAAIYEQLFKDEQDLLVATFDVMMMIGWKPHPSHDKLVAKRGSATHKIGQTIE